MQRCFPLLAAASLFMAGPGLAQELGLSAMYGRGVHAYFSGQAHLAYDALTAAIEAGSRDPRVFYFRGLVHQRLGRPQEAHADFRAGAELEHEDISGVFGVDRALERVQGASRLAIEHHRAAARVGAAQGIVLERQRRTLSAQDAAPHVSAPGDQILGEQPADFNTLPGPGAMPPVKGEVDRPFGNDPAAEPKPATTPATPAPPRPGAANPLNEQPFGEPAAKPAVPAQPKPAEPNPFGAPTTPAANKPAAEPNPFGAPPAATPPAATPPAATPPAATPPAATPPAATPPGDSTSGSGRAIGNALRRAFGGLMPSLPEVPAGLPLGGEAPAQPEDPARPAAPAPNAPAAPPAQDNPFGAANPPAPAKPANPTPAANENPFAKP